MATATARSALRPSRTAPAKRKKRYLPWRIAGYALFIGAWQLLSTHVFERYILPAPTVILQEMQEQVQRPDFWTNFSATLEHLFIGFAIAFTAGTLLGVLMGRSRYWNAFFSDYVMLTLTTPGLVFALITLMIFGLSTAAPIVAIFLTAMPHVTVNVVEGVRAIPRELLDMANAYGVGNRTRVRHIILPAVAPYLFTAVRFGFAIAWKITALTELFGGKEGVGIQIRVKYELFNIAGVLAWAFFLVAFALIMERVVLQNLERRFFRWRAQSYG